MNDSFGAGGFDATQSAGAGAARERRSDGVVPVVIKQLLHNNDDTFKVWGINAGIITLVGIVRSIDHSSTKITYRLEDHTGQIDAHQWLDEDKVASVQVSVNSYARIYGSFRSQGGTKTIMIFRLEPMANVNELTNHLLEVLNARYKAEALSKKGGASEFVAGGSGGGGGGAAMPSFGGNGGGGSSSTSNNPLGLSAIQLAVYEAIRRNKSDSGISFNELKSKFAHISHKELESHVEAMSNEGHIFTTIDAEHFKTTD